jgi:hypothetical protein
MLGPTGVALEWSGHDDLWPLLHVARARCSGCTSTDACDRWLAGQTRGDNGFCPNAQLFRIVERVGRRIAASVGERCCAHAQSWRSGARKRWNADPDRDASIRIARFGHTPVVYAVL